MKITDRFFHEISEFFCSELSYFCDSENFSVISSTTLNYQDIT